MNARILLILLSIMSIGCEQISPFISDVLWGKRLDVDQDGIPRPDDCDDSNPKVGTRIWYRDVDQDGYGAGEKIIACDQPTGATITDNDCDDTRANVYANAPEICDGLDNDCNGKTDELFPDLGTSCGTGICSNGTIVCNPDHLGTLCSSDTNKSGEICDELDNDCDGLTDEDVKTVFYKDSDKDGYGNIADEVTACTAPPTYILNHTDCDDVHASAHPGATEICDGIDNDCNGKTDETGLNTYYEDKDADGYGNEKKKIYGCSAPIGHVSDHTDCDDLEKAIHPNTDELCNGMDDNCNELTDEPSAVDVKTWYADSDQDGFGDALTQKFACTKPAGFVTNKLDCNDAIFEIAPTAKELCNEIDDDCNGQTDEGTQTTFFIDVDQDGYGSPLVKKAACAVPSGYTANKSDCNDLNENIHPNQNELCNGVDDNCNSETDEGVLLTYYKDADTDGYGNLSQDVTGCTAPMGYVANSSDCEDGNKNIHPNAIELCDNNVDENCDGITDNALEAKLWYLDADKDGYGNPLITKSACAGPKGYVADKTDCDDGNTAVHPNATEQCKDNIDNNCNGITDTDTKVSTWYLDTDKDGYGDVNQSKQDCAQPPGYVENATDCMDSNVLVHPSAAETCNNLIDDNCDGSVNQCKLGGTQSAAVAQTKIHGNANNLYLDTFTFGDVNGDGKDDLIIGAQYDSTSGLNAGAVYIFYGPIPSGNFSLSEADVKWTGESTGNKAGFSISSGDVNGDGKDDILVGAPSCGNTGCVYLISGSANLTSGSLSQATAKWTGELAKDQVGLVVNCTGDINGDGKNDLLVSVQRSLTSGKENGLVFLILGAQILMGGNLSTASVKWTLQSGGDFSGLNMRTGDTNSDGFDDVLIGARGNNQNGSYSGSAFLVYGNKNPTSTNLSNSLSNWYGESEYDRAGSCLGMGDIDGDGKSDLIIGSPGNKAGAYTGALNLLFGSVNLLGETLPGISTKWEGEKKLDQLGYGCTLRGDANGDGHKDIVVSAPYRNFVDTNEGMIYIIHGLGY